MNGELIVPDDYRPILSPKETERAIALIKDFFPMNLAFELNLFRTTAPLFVRSDTGINDHLTGKEKPLSFTAPGLEGATVEVVQSLAKWKRQALADLGIEPGQGIYTDMNAIRPDEILDNLHSLYVDQWDWELAIRPEDRGIELLTETVESIYDVIRRTEKFVHHHYPTLEPVLPENIVFLHSEELQQEYPDLNPREREEMVCEEYGAVFIIGIGAPLADGSPHDERAADYDDWSTETADGHRGLNGDLLVYNPVLECAFELSSMGIRVDSQGLRRQLAAHGEAEKEALPFHRRLLAGELPQSIGGGIGQSRLCMFYLKKAHIGEIQSGIWPAEMVVDCADAGIPLL